MQVFKRFAIAALAATALSGAAAAQTPLAAAASAPAARVTPAGDILATLTASGQFTTLLKALDATNLSAVLKGAGPLTLFAPTDAAFAALPAGQLDSLLGASPPAALQKLLTYHLINAKVDATKIKGAKGPIPSVAGTPVYIDGSGDPPKVNDADIAQTDLVVTNGVIYPIDKVLSPSFTPPPAAAEPAAEPAARAPAAKSTARKKK
jgi:uncharacterized surface protein with fasciclin (FAS1) repeats